MFVAVDVHYPPSGGARAALVMAGDARFSAIVSERTVFVDDVAPYRPGEFYRRELPPLRAVLAGVDDVDLLVIDGYVTLDPDGRAGLGAYANAEFGVPVIGVAKTRFVSAVHAVPVIRGSAKRPLYVTSAGVPLADAADLIRTMTGKFRLPDALRRVDALARGIQDLRFASDLDAGRVCLRLATIGLWQAMRVDNRLRARMARRDSGRCWRPPGRGAGLR